MKKKNHLFYQENSEVNGIRPALQANKLTAGVI